MATIHVVLAEPGKTARSAEIGTSLEELQSVVGGTIEAFYPFEEEVCISPQQSAALPVRSELALAFLWGRVMAYRRPARYLK